MNDLTVINDKNLSVWDDKESLREVKSLFAPKLNDLEFKAFVGLGKASGLNPFLREIWSIKYADNAPAQIFIARDGYRKAAQKNPDYDYHQADAVYSNDNYRVRQGEIEHDYNLVDRGKLIGAYCLVKRKSSSRPMHVFVDINEYNTNRSVWKEKPATMIKKVAEAQALRSAFQEQFGGTYSEDEYTPETQANKLKNRLAGNANNNQIKDINNTGENEVYEQPVQVAEAQQQEVDVIEQASSEENITLDQLTVIKDLAKEKGFTKDRMTKALAYFKVPDVNKLNNKQAAEFITLLEKA